MKSWVEEGGAITRDEQRAEELLTELRAEGSRCWSCGREGGLHYRSCLVPQVKRDPVRTSFDDVFPGMPPAIKLTA